MTQDGGVRTREDSQRVIDWAEGHPRIGPPIMFTTIVVQYLSNETNEINNNEMKTDDVSGEKKCQVAKVGYVTCWIMVDSTVVRKLHKKVSFQ